VRLSFCLLPPPPSAAAATHPPFATQPPPTARCRRRPPATAQLPHLLFYGPPGTGKTTCALALARQLFGPDLARARVLELNASDERGIAVVRDKIKGFAATAVGAPAPGFPCPPFKVIILDEADSMTGDAQNALRRTMENFSRVTRFIFVCNYVSRIIEPLASRCAKFRFRPLQGEAVHARLAAIAAAEGVELGAGACEALADVAGGDMRRAITALQSAVRLHGSPVTPRAVHDVAGAVPPAAAARLLAAARAGGFAPLQAAVLDAVAEGYPAQELLARLQAELLADAGASEAARGGILVRIAEADKALADGADEALQLLAVAAHAQKALAA
jgi:replication factor C subunit 2/4